MRLVSKNLSDIVTLSRASSKTYYDAQGVLQTLGSGEFAIDYDPATLTPRGIRSEEQRTNAIRNPRGEGAVVGTPGTLPANWFASYTANQGTLTANIVEIGTDAGFGYIDVHISGTPAGAGGLHIGFEAGGIVSASNGQVWSLSSNLKVVDGDLTNLTTLFQINERSTAFLKSVTGSPFSIGTGSFSAQRYSSSLTLTDASTTNITPVLVINYAAAVATDVTLRIAAPQLELGAFASSVILPPASSPAQATRLADSLTIGTLTPWYRADEGAWYAKYMLAGDAATSQYVVQVVADSSNYIAMYRDQSTKRAIGRARVSGSDSAFMFASASTLANNAVHKMAMGYKKDDFGASSNGETAVTDTSGNVPTGLTSTALGGSSYTTTVQLNGWLQELKFIPARKSNSELEAMTA